MGRSLSAPLKFFEPVKRNSRERSTCSQILPKLTTKCCRSPEVLRRGGWARPCAHGAPWCTNLLWLPACPQQAGVGARYLCLARGYECSVTNRFSLDSISWPYRYFVIYFHAVFYTHQFIRISMHFPHMLSFGSLSHILVCRHPQLSCSTALFEPCASEKVTYLSHGI